MLAAWNDLSEAELNQSGIWQNTLPSVNGIECIGNLSEEQICKTMFDGHLVQVIKNDSGLRFSFEKMLKRAII